MKSKEDGIEIKLEFEINQLKTENEKLEKDYEKGNFTKDLTEAAA